MTMYGADPQQLEHAARRVELLAESYNSANQQIEYWLRRMAWDGPEAARFRSQYSSEIRPQLEAMSGCLRQAATHLRVQAAEQLQASDATNLVGHTGEDGIPSAVGSSAAAMALGVLAGIPGLVFHADTIAGVGTFLASYAREFLTRPGYRLQDYLLRYEKVPRKVLGSTKGIFDALPKPVSKGLGVAGIVISAVQLPGDAVEAYDDWREIGNAIERGDRAAIEEAIEQFGYSSSDVLLDAGGITLGVGLMTGNPVVAGIGAGVLIAGGTVKLASFAYDHLREPVGQWISEVSDALGTHLAGVSDAVHDSVRNLSAELAEGQREIGAEIREGIREIAEAEGPIETAFEVFEAGAETAAEVGEAVLETAGSAIKGVYDVGKSLVSKPLPIAKSLLSWL